MINKTWDIVLSNEMEKAYFKNLKKMVKDEYQHNVIYPKYKDIFNALKITDYDKVKVVILGQDPYHGMDEAHGLSFSVQGKVKRPPSLNNIFKELYSDLGIRRDQNDLSDWAEQGVLLLNSVLTVQKDSPLSHRGIGWEIFTDHIIQKLNVRKEPIVFLLWGNYARSKKGMITNPNHHVIESAHPSPLSANRGFLGSKPFSKVNNYLKKKGIEPIKWG